MGREYPESIPLPEACLMLASSSGIHYLTSSAWLPRFLHKPGKDDYSAPTSYRLIALLNTLVKALKLVVAKMIGSAAWGALPLGEELPEQPHHPDPPARDTAEMAPTHDGIPQGSPLSLILYLFYNSGLLERVLTQEGVAVQGWADDACLLARGPTMATITALLKEAGDGGSQPELELGDTRILPREHGTYLGVKLDSRLDMVMHRRKDLAEAEGH
ncbi:hypothetical protein CBS147343_9504 [Aspergillus niger]|nr:hypothetical protein CBS12448_4898 [Aspergillus niger]KAI2909470.1 hypothetical protein CBS147371_9611 [Aspergillus niger]KAI2943663.1 hypothetical protein CBS147321_4600 [Aspergillus niger]KAI2957151.1 hypothetical protein CBS147322_2256 [Aspergillus niger]KAI2990360.1 hypothetical protein CBS147344_2343 [Aspergillus niger]